MSHNSKYYVKRLTKKDHRGTTKITDLFGNVSRMGKKLTKSPSKLKDTTECEIIIEDVTESTTVSITDAPVSTAKSSIEHVHKKILIETMSIDSSNNTLKMINKPVQLQGEKIQGPDQRRFNSAKYESTYPWVYHSLKKRGFICKYCELFGTQNRPFVDKGVSFGTHPTRTLECHLKSEGHKTSMEKYHSSRSCQLKLTNPKLNTQEFNRSALKKIFECVDFLVRQKWAVSENTEKFVTFVANLGVKDLEQHMKSKTVKYLSSSSVTQMVKCLSDLRERQILDDLRTKEFAILADETTDVSHRSQLSIMARFAKATSNVATHFLGFCKLEQGTAEYIMAALETFLVAKNIDKENIRFVALDGCNTMSGVQKGLQRRIRHISPFSAYINCRNHRLALCLVHLIKRFPILQDVDATLLSLWKLFEFSAQRMEVFKHIQAVYGKEPLTITRAATTRWLSHLQAAARFIGRFVCILDTLDALYDKRREPEVYGLRLNCTNKKVVATILLLCDILKPVNMLSLYLQEEHVNFTSLPKHVKITTDSLHAVIQKYEGNDWDDVEFAKSEQIFQEIDDRTDLARRMRDNQQALDPRTFLQETGIPLIYDLIQEIEDAFCTGAPVLSAFAILNPDNLPDTVGELKEYGNNHIQTLVDFYGSRKEDTFMGHTVQMPALMDPLLLKTELESFKTHLFMLRRNGAHSVGDLYTEFSTDGVLRECFPLVYRLVYFSMIIPSSTAVVERSFSLLANILTKKRNRLGQGNLDAVMRICHVDEGLTDQEKEELVDLFKHLKTRKLYL